MPAAVVLAGGAPDSRLAPGLPNKAFLEIAGRSIVARVLDALRGCASIDRVVLVGPVQPLSNLLGSEAKIVAERDSMVANIDAAVEALPGVQRILIVASDLPLLTAAVIEHFLTLCREDADVFYPIVPQAVVESRYPGARKTYVKVTDGTFTGGSVLLFGVSMLDRIRPLVEQVIAGRKNPVLLAKLFGGATLFKFFAGRLSIAELEARAYEIARIRGRAVVTDRPEIALDVDAERPGNLDVIRRALAEGPHTGGSLPA